MKVEVVVIGGGPAGLAAACKAWGTGVPKVCSSWNGIKNWVAF